MAYRTQICQLFDDRLAPARKLAAIHRMMQGDRANAHAVVDRVEKLLASLTDAERSTPEFKAALAEIALDRATGARVMATARATREPAMRVRLVSLAGTLGWVTPEEQRAEHAQMIAELLGRNAMGFAEVDLACNLGEGGALEGEIRKVGGDRITRVNPRVIAATNRDLRAAVAAGTFREDLYFRLGAFVTTVPPLRDRREAIPTLVHQFLRAAAKKMKKDVRGLSPEAMTLLVSYHWPGNVRELEHAVQRAVILAHGPTVTIRELPPEVRSGTPDSPASDSLDLGEHERRAIIRALKRFGGNRRRAAEALKISTVTLWRRMKRYGLDVPSRTDASE